MEQQILEYFLSLKYPISIYPEEEDEIDEMIDKYYLILGDE